MQGTIRTPRNDQDAARAALPEATPEEAYFLWEDWKTLHDRFGPVARRSPSRDSLTWSTTGPSRGKTVTLAGQPYVVYDWTWISAQEACCTLVAMAGPSKLRISLVRLTREWVGLPKEDSYSAVDFKNHWAGITRVQDWDLPMLGAP